MVADQPVDVGVYTPAILGLRVQGSRERVTGRVILCRRPFAALHRVHISIHTCIPCG